MPRFLLSISLITLLTACTGTPENVSPVKDFQIDRYLGTWYEIARLDHSFERGLEQVSATYSLRDDGGITVLNKGYSTKDSAWSQAEGKAYLIDARDAENRGHLKVSFFGPFYSSYIIFELDQEAYQYAFISGYNKNYLWLLSRTPHIDAALREQFVQQAQRLGFATEQLIWVEHTASDSAADES